MPTAPDQPAGHGPVDLQPLATAPEPAAARHWQQRAEAGEFGDPTARWLAARHRRRRVVFGEVGGVVVLPSLVAAVLQLINGENVLVPVLVIVGAIVVGTIWWAVLRREDGRDWAKRAALQGFVEATFPPGTALEPRADDPTPPLPGMIFAAGGHPVTTDRVAWTTGGRRAEIAGRQYVLGTRTRNDVYRCRYLAVRLGAEAGRPVRVILELLTATGDPASSLPMTYPDLPTTGIGSPAHPAHDRYELRCLGRDVKRAKALLTDRVLDLLFDELRPFEAEIADGWFFAYSFAGADPNDPELWGRLLGIAEELGAGPPAAG